MLYHCAHKLDPDRCVQSMYSLKNKYVGLSCVLSLVAGFLLQCTQCSRQARRCETKELYLYIQENLSSILQKNIVYQLRYSGFWVMGNDSQSFTER